MPTGQNGINMKFVKPSELNLDFINPNLKGIKSSSMGGANTSTNQSNVQNILGNLRTP
jgi:hypothetical protein